MTSSITAPGADRGAVTDPEQGSKPPPELLTLTPKCRAIGKDLRQQELLGANLEGADLSQSDLSEVDLRKANLRNAILYQTKLQGADFTGADLTGAQFRECKANQACFAYANLNDTEFFGADLQSATFTQAKAQNADFRRAKLTGARAREGKFDGTNFNRADLTGADMEGISTERAIFDEAVLSGSRLVGATGYLKASWIRSDIRDVDFGGAYLLRRFIIDQNYLHEFRNQSRLHEWLYRAWWITSDCGRSFLRWSVLIIAMILGFGAAYQVVDLDLGSHPTPLSPLYFSVVTLTTLGFGDVQPASTSAQILVMLEVTFGYLLLGGLLSIFSNKMGRRGD